MRSHTLKMGLVALFATIPALALAHPGHEHTTSFMSGFMHPMGGLDHLLAMLAIGLWAASLGGRALWAIPTAFVGTMLVGGGLAVAGVQVPFIEQGIILSVILMGALLVGAARFPVAICAGIAGLFAVFHGAAHGLEMPLNANGAEYALGFAAATALLHLVGIGFGAVIARFQAPIITRVTGSLIAIAGLFLALI
ncbi:HupE/UreJ family protein [Marinomonas sp. RSW2]|uniref:HupE/UreJ family protein n=1 Tax=Marinomonas maritima TaxID=2940935 RepID=A0ABT5WD48_9GAMM|nr:HupE/UreJ family protein [Marinomonas maritima]MDE8601995.1 HupE/UreJ family protein [Marinomonas maritima]